MAKTYCHSTIKASICHGCMDMLLLLMLMEVSLAWHVRYPATKTTTGTTQKSIGEPLSSFSLSLSSSSSSLFEKRPLTDCDDDSIRPDNTVNEFDTIRDGQRRRLVSSLCAVPLLVACPYLSMPPLWPNANDGGGYYAYALKPRNEALCGTGLFENFLEYRCTSIGNIQDEGYTRPLTDQETQSTDSLLSKLGVLDPSSSVPSSSSPSLDVNDGDSISGDSDDDNGRRTRRGLEQKK